MIAERKIFDKRSLSEGSEDLLTLRAIWAAASALKLNRDRVEWVIKNYAERNALVHSSVRRLIQAGEWPPLAIILYNDAKDLPIVTPPGMMEDIEYMSAVIRSLRERYFVFDYPNDANYPITWSRSKEALQYRGVLRVKPDTKDNKISEKIGKQAAKAARKRARQEELLKDALQGKRMAKQPFRLGDKMLAKKTKEMEKVVGIQTQVKKMESELDELYKSETW